MNDLQLHHSVLVLEKTPRQISGTCTFSSGTLNRLRGTVRRSEKPDWEKHLS